MDYLEEHKVGQKEMGNEYWYTGVHHILPSATRQALLLYQKTEHHNPSDKMHLSIQRHFYNSEISSLHLTSASGPNLPA